MKKIILALIVSILFFGVGLAGAYLAMPTLAPDMVANMQQKLDSISAAEQQMDAVQDTLQQLFSMDSVILNPSTVLGPIQAAMGTLRDSVSLLEGQLQMKEAEQSLLLKRVEDIEAKWADLETKFNDAREISGTIVKLEDAELAELLNQVDPLVLEAIYLEATARNRARLLQMLPAEKAATIVNKLASPRPPPNPTTTAAANANALLGNQED